MLGQPSVIFIKAPVAQEAQTSRSGAKPRVDAMDGGRPWQRSAA